jgi:hypothetical protein
MPLLPAPPLHIRPSVRRDLMTLATKPTAPQRAVRRALVLLDAASGVSNAAISRQRKIAIESLYQDAPGRGRPKEMSDAKAAKIITTTMQSVRKNATHWTAEEMARRFSVSSSTIYRLWRAHNLQPHRVQNFKFSTDPDFVTKLRDVVGLYMNPPTNAIVLSVDEKERSPGTRANGADLAAASWHSRATNARLSPERHDHSVCRPRHTYW